MSYRATRSVADLFDAAPLEMAARRIAKRCQERLLELVREYTPVAEAPEGADVEDWLDRRVRAPGTLRDSWEEGEIEVMSHGRIRVSVLTRDEVAPHVEYPTKPHVIRARRVSYLRFWMGGEVVYRRAVFHPGTEGAFMMGRALAQLRREWELIARRELGAL